MDEEIELQPLPPKKPSLKHTDSVSTQMTNLSETEDPLYPDDDAVYRSCEFTPPSAQSDFGGVEIKKKCPKFLILVCGIVVIVVFGITKLVFG